MKSLAWGSQFVLICLDLILIETLDLDGQENLDNFKKLVSMIEKSQPRSRNLKFVLTPPSSPKNLDRD